VTFVQTAPKSQKRHNGAEDGRGWLRG